MNFGELDEALAYDVRLILSEDQDGVQNFHVVDKPVTAEDQSTILQAFVDLKDQGWHSYEDLLIKPARKATAVAAAFGRFAHAVTQRYFVARLLNHELAETANGGLWDTLKEDVKLAGKFVKHFIRLTEVCAKIMDGQRATWLETPGEALKFVRVVHVFFEEYNEVYPGAIQKTLHAEIRKAVPFGVGEYFMAPPDASTEAFRDTLEDIVVDFMVAGEVYFKPTSEFTGDLEHDVLLQKREAYRDALKARARQIILGGVSEAFFAQPDASTQLFRDTLKSTFGDVWSTLEVVLKGPKTEEEDDSNKNGQQEVTLKWPPTPNPFDKPTVPFPINPHQTHNNVYNHKGKGDYHGHNEDGLSGGYGGYSNGLYNNYDSDRFGKGTASGSEQHDGEYIGFDTWLPAKSDSDSFGAHHIADPFVESLRPRRPRPDDHDEALLHSELFSTI